jgi:diaminohydroxyphosphoribosylaminopyrimidine deaminase/5-amino-6-(5-phosphoribosylamino)uracil reductase
MADTFTSFDQMMMARALMLARRGIYTTAPNPRVGCVITQGDKIVGEGYHYKAGEPHAEVFALRAADGKTAGATAYVTLEPCSHFGRTPPCAEALIKAGVGRVVCAMQDPNPQVAGRGIALLKAANVTVSVGLLEQDAVDLNPGFIKQMQTGLPYVQLKLAASLDGQTALKNGQSQWITSPEARRDVQAYRAQSGAILSTSKTVMDDDASLNVRWDDLPPSVQALYPEPELRQPKRIILDRQGQLMGAQADSQLRLFQTSGDIIRVSTGTAADLTVPLDINGRLDLSRVLNQLASQYQVNQLWVEAGATLAASLIEQQLVDELILYLAPKLMGSDGRGLIHLLGLEQMTQAIELDITDLRRVGADIRVTARIKNRE